MSRGFVAVDRAALALCQGDDEAMCLFLMTRSQDAAWSPERPEPGVDVGRTYWSERAGISESHFRRLLDRLVDAGRAVIVHPGDRRTTKRIRLVVDVGAPEVSRQPFPQPPANHRQPPTPVVSESCQPSADLPPTFPPQILETPPTITLQPSSNTDVRPKADPAGDLWSAYAALRAALPPLPKPAPAGRASAPRIAPTASPDARKAMSRILTECGGPERARVYLEWVHTSGDHAALRLRGEAPWPDGAPKVLLDPESLSRHIPARLVEAEAWDMQGRPAARASAQQARTDRANAPLRRGDLFLVPSQHDAHEGAIDTPFEAL